MDYKELHESMINGMTKMDKEAFYKYSELMMDFWANAHREYLINEEDNRVINTLMHDVKNVNRDLIDALFKKFEKDQ